MHYRLVLLALVAAVSAQSVPQCATDCVTNDIPKSCNSDPSCICKYPGFIDEISCCVFKACDTAGQQAALSYAQSICKPVGVTTLPTAAGCTGSAATATSSGQSSASGSATSASSGATTSSAESSAATTAAASTSASSSGSANSSATSSSAAAATTSNAANPLAVQGAGVVCAGLLGLAGML